MVVFVVIMLVMGLNFGIDFKGGIMICIESLIVFEVGDYWQVLDSLNFGDVLIIEVFDFSFGVIQYVVMICIGMIEEIGLVMFEQFNQVQVVLQIVDLQVKFVVVELVGFKVLGELIKIVIYVVGVVMLGIMFYIWLWFEWQFVLGVVVLIVYDVLLIIGLFLLFQLKFDLMIIVVLLIMLGFLVNDMVVVFDRLCENLIKFKNMLLIDVMNLICNEILLCMIMMVVMISIVLGVMLIFGGDVICEFVIVMLWGVLVGCYLMIYVVKNIVLWLGVKCDWIKLGEKKEKVLGEDIFVVFWDVF